MITLASREFVLSSLELCEWRTSLVCLSVRVSVCVRFVGFRVNIVQSVYLYMAPCTDTSWCHVQQRCFPFVHAEGSRTCLSRAPMLLSSRARSALMRACISRAPKKFISNIFLPALPVCHTVPRHNSLHIFRRHLWTDAQELVAASLRLCLARGGR